LELSVSYVSSVFFIGQFMDTVSYRAIGLFSTGMDFAEAYVQKRSAREKSSAHPECSTK
jgi:hypothetical protein